MLPPSEVRGVVADSVHGYGSVEEVEGMSEAVLLEEKSAVILSHPPPPVDDSDQLSATDFGLISIPSLSPRVH